MPANERTTARDTSRMNETTQIMRDTSNPRARHHKNRHKRRTMLSPYPRSSSALRPDAWCRGQLAYWIFSSVCKCCSITLFGTLCLRHCTPHQWVAVVSCYSGLRYLAYLASFHDPSKVEVNTLHTLLVLEPDPLAVVDPEVTPRENFHQAKTPRQGSLIRY